MHHRSRPLAEADRATIAEQLWPGLDGPDFRVSTHPASAGWVLLAVHAVVTWRGQAIMVLPISPTLAARSLTEYSHLRPRSRRLLRRLWAGAIRLSLPIATNRIALHARAGTEAATRRTTLAHAAAVIPRAEYLVAAMSVRRTANRKALLHLISDQGETVGFAKLAWNPGSSAAIRTEAKALASFSHNGSSGRSSLVRVPEVILSEEVNGFPVLITAPLPARIHRLSTNGAPSVGEYREVAGDLRSGAPASSAHIRTLRQRIDLIRREVAADPAPVRRAAQQVADLLERVEQAEGRLEIGSRWHGDLSPWNVGRDEGGVLWCWDLENGHADALFGLDIVHWHFSRLRAAGGLRATLARPGVVEGAHNDLVAAGLDRHQRQIVHAAHRVEVATRALEMGCADGWARVWVGPSGVIQLATWPETI